MEKILFEKRDVQGKKNKILLKEAKTPAVVYNSKGDSRSISIDSSIAGKISREATSTTILDAEYDGKSMKVVVKEIDMNPITEEIRHVSFFEIDESKEMVFTVPFEIVGISPAVKNNLGVMVEVMNSLEIKCKVADLVPFIEVDISVLEHPGQSIAVEDLNIPKTLSLVNEDLKNATVVTVTELQAEEVYEAPVAEEAADATAAETPAEGAETEEVKE